MNQQHERCFAQLPGDGQALRWAEVDLEHSCLRFEDSKTGQKVVFLNSAAREVLKAIDREPGNPFVIRGAKTGSHLVNLEKPWRRLRDEAGLADVRLRQPAVRKRERPSSGASRHLLPQGEKEERKKGGPQAAPSSTMSALSARHGRRLRRRGPTHRCRRTGTARPRRRNASTRRRIRSRGAASA